MFHIAPSQFELLERRRDESVQAQALRLAAARWGRAPEAVTEEFGGCLAQRQALGFRTVADLSGYLDLVRDCTADFPDFPWAAPFFTKRPLDHPAGTLTYLRVLARAHR